jgi:RNA polymerase sigma-B factor
MDERPRASRSDVERWCIEYRATRDPAVRDELVATHQWLVHIYARRMRRRSEPLDDLVQVANLGLLQAIDRFDPTYGVAFNTFASATMLGMLRRHYRSSWRVHVPRQMQEVHLKVSAAIDELTTALQRSPTLSDIAKHLDLTEEQVLEATEVGENYWPGSLTSDSNNVIDEQLGVLDERLETADERAEVHRLLARLPERERAILYLRFFEQLTQAEIGERLHLSQVHVSRLMRVALDRLRRTRDQQDQRRFLVSDMEPSG